MHWAIALQFSIIYYTILLFSFVRKHDFSQFLMLLSEDEYEETVVCDYAYWKHYKAIEISAAQSMLHAFHLQLTRMRDCHDRAGD